MYIAVINNLALQLTEIFNLFLIISAIHGFAFGAFLFKRNSKENKAITFLNAMIIVIALNNLQSWLLAKEISFLNYIQIPWHFLIAPFFYTFLVNYLKIEKTFLNIIKVVLPLFIVSILLQITYFYFTKDTKTAFEYHFLYEKYTSFEEAISFIISLNIFFYCFHIIKYKRNLFLNILSYDNLKWINNFIILAGVSYILWAFALSLKFYLNFKDFIIFFYPLRIMTTILIYWLGYELVFILRQVEERKSIRKANSNNTEQEITNYSKKFERVKDYIVNNRRYLDNALSLETLSKELQISNSQLSKIINEQTSQNFNHLINGFRIDFSKKILLDPNYNNYTITSIALESGFNSKSTFYNAFKKHTGVTPTQFKEKNV